MRAPGRARSVVAIVVVPLLALFVALPLAIIVLRSLADPTVYVSAISSRESRAALLNSLAVGGGAATLAFVIGAPLGAALARLRIRGTAVLQTLLVLPLAAPSYIWAMAWISLGAPRAGWLNQLAGHTWLDIYGLHGIIWVEGLALYPLVLLPTRAALEAADPTLEEAARISGAGPLRAFLTGSAPLGLPAAGSGALLAFLAGISSFGVPWLLGVATAHPALVATTRIYQALALGARRDVGAALALCMILLVFAASAALLATRFARARVAAGAGKGRRIAPLAAPALARAGTVAAWLVAFVAVLLPVGAVLLSALTRHYGRPPTADNLGLEQFADVLGKRDVHRALAHSAWLAFACATAVVFAGAALAFLRRGRVRASAALVRLAEIPYAVPGSVLALAMLLAFSQQVRFIVLDRVTIVFEVMGTLWILGIAYAVKYLAFGARAADDAFRALDPALEEAARISGAGPARAFLDIALPLARPSLVAAWILVFLPAATELTMSVLLVGPRTQTMGTVLFDLASYADPPSGAVLACIVIALAASADIVLRYVSRTRMQGSLAS